MTRLRTRTFVLTLALLAAASLAVACGGDSAGSGGSAPSSVSVQQAAEKMKSGKPLLVDVREPSEWTEVHVEGARLAPLAKVTTELAAVDRSQEILLICRSGRRSAKAQQALAEQGFTNLRNVEGGMLAWEKAGLPVVRGSK